MIKINIGLNIANARKAKGITQKELAEIIGATQRDISRWENNKFKPSITKVAAIAKALGCLIDDLI